MRQPGAETPVGALPTAAWGVFGLGLACAFHVGKLPVSLPLLQAELGVTLLQAGFLLSLLQVAGMATGLWVGGLADRWGPQRVMLCGLLILGLGSAWGAWAPSAGVLLASRLLESLGFLWAVLPAPAWLRQRVSEPRSLHQGLGLWGASCPRSTPRRAGACPREGHWARRWRASTWSATCWRGAGCPRAGNRHGY